MQECDLIMKGGITSGIVYPPAILRLQERYRFRNVGGASAGAIAAAFAAAAEYGRDRGGFEKLEARRRELSTGTFLRDLFQPTARTGPLFDAAYGLWAVRARFRERRRKGTLGPGLGPALRALVPDLARVFRRATGSRGGTARALLLAALLAGLTALLFAAGQALVREPVAWRGLAAGGLLLLLPLSLIAAPLGALAAGLAGLARGFAREVPRNYFGLCNGRADPAAPGRPRTPALTDWMHECIQDLAGGPARPLTFGDLAARGIRLTMVTTNLSHRRGYDLPSLGDRPGDDLGAPQATFAFRADEFRVLFPDPVVDAMAGDGARSLGDLVLPEGYFAFPRGADLPVVVATRMSLSFPVLVSAVPLYTVRRSAVDRLRAEGRNRLEPGDLQRNWFSDGGIASNFPIHLFDNWLPARPTFGIQLTELPPAGFEPDPTAGWDCVSRRYVSAVRAERDGPGAVAAEANKAVYLPRGDEVLEPEWRPIEGWGAFAGAIFDTLHDAHDNLQSSIPGYRERVVQVRLSSEEGGLNLTMPEHTIELVMAKGRAAGDKILQYFDMDQHRWVRFRVLMAELERNLAILEERLASRFDLARLCAIETGAAGRVARPGGEARPGVAAARFPYPRDAVWCGRALERVRGLRELARAWAAEVLFGEGQDPPAPMPVLRVVPRE